MVRIKKLICLVLAMAIFVSGFEIMNMQAGTSFTVNAATKGAGYSAANKIKKPAPTKFTKVKLEKDRIFVSIKMIKNIKWYELQWATNKKFKNKDWVLKTSPACYLGNLKKGKTYYLRVRTFIKVGNKKICSKWSKVKKVKIKK